MMNVKFQLLQPFRRQRLSSHVGHGADAPAPGPGLPGPAAPVGSGASGGVSGVSGGENQQPLRGSDVLLRQYLPSRSTGSRSSDSQKVNLVYLSFHKTVRGTEPSCCRVKLLSSVLCGRSKVRVPMFPGKPGTWVKTELLIVTNNSWSQVMTFLSSRSLMMK